MSETKQTYSVTNRSGGTVGYTIPDLNISRFFAVGETKRNISLEELEKLSYTRGGRNLLMNDLQLTEEGVKALDLEVEQEYYLSEDEIKELLLGTNNYDQFLDALDFAPEGVIDIMKNLAVSLPIRDMNKAQAISEKTGLNVLAAIQHNKEFNADNAEPVAEAKERRVKPTTTETTPARRVPEYKVVNNK